MDVASKFHFVLWDDIFENLIAMLWARSIRVCSRAAKAIDCGANGVVMLPYFTDTISKRNSQPACFCKMNSASTHESHDCKSLQDPEDMSESQLRDYHYCVTQYYNLSVERSCHLLWGHFSQERYACTFYNDTKMRHPFFAITRRKETIILSYLMNM